jgi:hypothetical protein
MVDFKKLREAKAKPKPVNPRDIFNALPKPPGINYLYASQAEALDSWFARRIDKDVVVKLHTGGGKTLVALLMAHSRQVGEAFWWARQDSNLQPDGYEPSALTIELQARPGALATAIWAGVL